jgi:demethylmenaquinone methyltransferase/2-methoxy-6-polyprenyl-1,4-benzoquinol methylase
MKQNKLYPKSGVELTKFSAHTYDIMMNVLTFGKYIKFIHKAISDLGIKPTSTILDLGCGTGRNAELMLQYLGDEGKIIGIDLSPIMQKQFENRFKNEKRLGFQKRRIDIPFDLGEKVDIVFISFVIHGFPNTIRNEIIENVKNHLKPDGILAILDFAEFNIDKMPYLYRWIFKTFECQYAFDFIKRDWKKIFNEKGFETISEELYFKKYVRLLQVKQLQ